MAKKKAKAAKRVKKSQCAAFAPVVLGQRGLWSEGPGWARFNQSGKVTR